MICTFRKIKDFKGTMMKLEEFSKFVDDLEQKYSLRVSTQNLRALHATLGICGEAGELVDIVKKQFAYGKEVDVVHLAEEMGDVFHYLIMLSNIYGLNFNEIVDANVRKLKARYPTGFSEERALNRDLEKEKRELNK